MANLTFKTGAKAKFPETKTPGQLSFITDGATGSIYLDIDANNRVKFNADAKKLDHTVQINDTNFDGSSSIRTNSWGWNREFKIGNYTLDVDGSQEKYEWSLKNIGISKKYASFATPSSNSWGWYTIATIADNSTSPAIFFVRAYAHSSMIFTVSKGYSTTGSLNVLDYNASANQDYAAITGARLMSDGRVQIYLRTKKTSDSTQNALVDVEINAINSSDTLTIANTLVADDTANPSVIITRNCTVTGNIIGNLQGSASSLRDKTNGTETYLNYGAEGISSTSWFAAWNGYELRAISPVNSRITMSALSATKANGFYGMGEPDGNTQNWIRTTEYGIIPYQSGGSSALGTSSWPFNSIYSNKGYFGGTSTNTYALNTSSFICDSWIRTKGETGWYNETYSGGWFMNDTTWIKAYNGKKVYVSNTDSNAIKTEGGIAASTIETTAGTPIFRLADDISMSSLGTSADIGEYVKLYIKSICSKYPGKHGVFRGKCSPNSVAYVEVYIYDTSRVDSTTGLPEYCFGTWRQYSNSFYNFWTSNYTFGITSIVNSGNFSGILDSYYDSRYLKLSGGTMTGALNLKNGTWNKAGDDSQFGDNNTAGSFAIQGLNGATNLKMVKYGDANNYGTITWDGTDFIFSSNIVLATNKHLYMTYNSTNYPVVYNHNNGNVSLRACGNGLYVGYGDTTGIYFGPTGNWGAITSSGYSGNAASATKLATARSIFGKSFDGTGNVAGQPLVYGAYTATASARYSNSGIQVRENGLVGSAQSDIGYAPSIGFHWAGRIAATLNFHSDGIFYFRKQDGTSRATIDANVNGWASSAGSASTATKLVSTSDLTFGVNTFQYFNFSGTAGSVAEANDTPTSAWWHIQRHVHSNSTSHYYTDVAVPFNSPHMYYKRITAGSLADGGWVMMYDTKNIVYSSAEPTSGLIPGMIWLKPV